MRIGRRDRQSRIVRYLGAVRTKSFAPIWMGCADNRVHHSGHRFSAMCVISAGRLDPSHVIVLSTATNCRIARCVARGSFHRCADTSVFGRFGMAILFFAGAQPAQSAHALVELASQRRAKWGAAVFFGKSLKHHPSLARRYPKSASHVLPVEGVVVR
jgi:hypothetical protein